MDSPRADPLRRHTRGDLLHRRAARNPDKTAIVCGAVRWSCREFDRLCDRLAAGLAACAAPPPAIALSGSDLDEAAVLAHCARQLASFKAPKAVLLVDALPKNTSGKRPSAR